ncbi:MAG: rcp [Acidimicrobiaceae bacterium]|nr:rcp [Acidimicrobiaceae bacterium]
MKRLAEPEPARLELLLVEDDPGDVMMTQEALEEAGDLIPAPNLHVASDGAEALDFLLKRGRHRGAPAPDLVLLDLNLPKVGGQEVLARVKGDASLHRIPIVVLTTSDAHDDIVRCYEHHANAYVTKPGGYESFASAVREVVHTFTQVATPPPRARN